MADADVIIKDDLPHSPQVVSREDELQDEPTGKVIRGHLIRKGYRYNREVWRTNDDYTK